MMLTLCILCDIKLLASTRAALTLHQRENNPLPNQDRRTKVCTLFQSLAFPHRLGPAHEPTARTQPFKHKRSQSLVSCDTCKNKPVHEVMPFRPLSTNAQKSCCSKTTYQHELEKKKLTELVHVTIEVSFFWTSRVPYRFLRKTQNHTIRIYSMKRPCI